MTISVLIDLLKKYCIMEQIESVMVKDNTVTVLSTAVADVKRNRFQLISRFIEYNVAYSEWECTTTYCKTLKTWED